MVNESDVDQLRAALEAAERDKTYAWECAENMKDWTQRAEDKNRELRAERDALKERAEIAEEQRNNILKRSLEQRTEADALKERLRDAQNVAGQLHTESRELRALKEQVEGAREDFSMIVASTPHMQRCDEPDDPSCARCVADSALARLDQRENKMLEGLAPLRNSDDLTPLDQRGGQR